MKDDSVQRDWKDFTVNKTLSVFDPTTLYHGRKRAFRDGSPRHHPVRVPHKQETTEMKGWNKEPGGDWITGTVSSEWGPGTPDTS